MSSGVVIFIGTNEKYLEKNNGLFSDLNEFNQCGVALSRINNKTISNGKDDEHKISSMPTGFPKEKDNLINGKYIFERCHLIGYSLYAIRDDNNNAQNVNLKRVFTGTRFMNNIMFYYEKQVVEYVKGTDNYVLYRVTPYFRGDYPLAYGVQMEAKFIKSNGEEDKNLSFNVFVYNKQPHIQIDYETAKFLLDNMIGTKCKYILDKEKKMFHIHDCASTWDFDDDRKENFDGERKTLIQKEYQPCGICDPY